VKWRESSVWLVAEYINLAFSALKEHEYQALWTHIPAELVGFNGF